MFLPPTLASQKGLQSFLASSHHPMERPHDFFLLALQQAAISCLHLLQPPASPPPADRTPLHDSLPTSCAESPVACVVDSSPFRVQKSSAWAEFAEESFVFPALDDFDSLLPGAQPDQRVIPPTHESGVSVSDRFEIQWADLHSLDNLHSSGDVDYSWLDSLPPIEGLDSTSEKFELVCSMPPAENFDRSSEKFESLCSTSSSSLSSQAGKEEFGPEIETTLAQPQSAVRNDSCSSTPLIDQEQSDERKATSPGDSESRKRRRISDPFEPTYQIVTESEEEILDDGFKWRKYGQKNVKNSIYPRSYYRCSYPGGCKVLKQVQRSPVDHSLVWTTYKGKHAHHCPALTNTKPPLHFDG